MLVLPNSFLGIKYNQTARYSCFNGHRFAANLSLYSYEITCKQQHGADPEGFYPTPDFPAHACVQSKTLHCHLISSSISFLFFIFLRQRVWAFASLVWDDASPAGHDRY